MPSHFVSSLLVGFALALGTIVVHGLVVHTIVMALRRNLQRGLLGMRLWVNLTFIMSTTLLALAWASRGDRPVGVRARYLWRGRRYQRGRLFIGRQLHDFRFRHRPGDTMEALGTL